MSSTFKSKYYSLNIKFDPAQTYIKMQMLHNIFHTSKLPQTHQILSQLLPNIHTSECFNDSKLPFSSEVKNTEIGHLFEHILLEYICKFKFLYQKENITVSGETSWNWQKDRLGLFHIHINFGKENSEIFSEALNHATVLLNTILASHEI